MGHRTLVYPLTDDMKTWLAGEGIAYPDLPSRFPTAGELKAALGRIERYPVAIRDSKEDRWDRGAVIGTGERDQTAILSVPRWRDDHQPQEFNFHRGAPGPVDELIRLLVPTCGPLVTIHPGGGPPEVVCP